MKVYRIEHPKDNLGPYWSAAVGSQTEWTRDGRPHYELHPMPRADVGRRPRSDEVCGFDSIRKLNEWFTPTERQRMRALGFKLRVFNVLPSDVTCGHKQLLFRR